MEQANRTGAVPVLWAVARGLALIAAGWLGALTMQELRSPFPEEATASPRTAQVQRVEDWRGNSAHLPPAGN
jgi:hypothetical protein